MACKSRQARYNPEQGAQDSERNKAYFCGQKGTAAPISPCYKAPDDIQKWGYQTSLINISVAQHEEILFRAEK